MASAVSSNAEEPDWDLRLFKRDPEFMAQVRQAYLQQRTSNSTGAVTTQDIKILAADPAFAFRDLYAFPNPARAGENVTIRVQVGLADSIEVAIYDVSGRQVYSGKFDAAKALDDGNGKGPQYAYDHTWSTNHAGSGLYLFVVTARKAGGKDIRKTGKVGVIR